MYKKIVSLVLILGVMAGCKKDPSLVSPKDQYATSNYPASIGDLNSVLASCYSNLRDQFLYGFAFLPKMMANCTHAADAAYSDPNWSGYISVNTLNPSNGFVSGAWQALFTGVKNCNTALAGADFFEKTYAKAADKASIDYVRGQAYFLRAWYYFELENLYGEDYLVNPSATDTLGVPVFEGLPSSLAATQQGRSSIAAVWALIYKDLQQSATLLKGQVWTGNDIGRVTEWSAKALLGKAYVFRKDWADAKTVLKDVIDNSGKSLMPYTKYHEAFDGNSVNEFNEESLFELNVDQDSKGGYGVYSGAANATTINGLIWPPYALGDDGTENASNPLGYGGNDGLHDKNVVRYGFNLGTFQLVTNPNFDNSKPASYTNPAKVMDPVYKQKSIAARTNGTVDPRLYVSTLQPWVDSVKPDGQHWYPVSRPSYIMGDANLASEYGWSFRKYTPILNNINNVGPADAANIYILRLADVYLLYAEASAGSSDDVTALEYLNKVKRRAYSLDINTPSGIDYKSLTDQTSAAVAGDPVLGSNPLYYERWAELFAEGNWWFDVCRWHLGQSEDAFYVTSRTLQGTPFTWNDKAYAWPIPLTEINSNPKVAHQQNPGY
ncbi:MAG TPA: RagB/SusD family nutrient uptake outer membrane protein [Puia sp.]|nr:RagB/SusD family nutrient uptake outer membrane protein [Puia sp.]